MYYLQDTILKIKLGKGDKDRRKTMEKLLGKLRSRVYHENDELISFVESHKDYTDIDDILDKLSHYGCYE